VKFSWEGGFMPTVKRMWMNTHKVTTSQIWSFVRSLFSQFIKFSRLRWHCSTTHKYDSFYIHIGNEHIEFVINQWAWLSWNHVIWHFGVVTSYKSMSIGSGYNCWTSPWVGKSVSWWGSNKKKVMTSHSECVISYLFSFNFFSFF